jgi:TolA-binding protein
MPAWGNPGSYAPQPPPAGSAAPGPRADYYAQGPADEAAMLREQAEMLEQQLEQINGRISELEQQMQDQQ